MSEDFSWVPGTAAALIGLVAGFVIAFRLRQAAPGGKRGERERRRKAHDLELEVADLEARRDTLYERLRAAGDDDLGDAEVRSLELAAARVLRDLDSARADLGKVRPAAKRKADKRPPEAEPEPAPSAAGHNPVLWFATGAGLMALVAFLVYWASLDVRPGPRGMPGAGGEPPPAAAADEGHTEDLESLPPAVRAQVEQLQAELAARPANLGARKQLMVLLAQNELYFHAFQHSEEILRVDSDDPDALYVSALVRLTMGQFEESLGLVDRVLARFPEHVFAHLIRGMALVRLGRRDDGLAAWRSGLEAAGGSNPAIEQMIADEFGSEAVAGGAGAAPATAAPAAAAPSAPPPATGGARIYRVHIELATGAEVTPGSSLFVSVHDPAAGGPPAAVKRVVDPDFPLEVSLSSSDSMMGLELPTAATIQVRLDRDGDPGTESPDDLFAQGEGRSGEVTKFVLW